MIYKPANMGSFMQNYMSADGSGDKKMKRDILISEIAKIIVASPRKVMGHLKLYGFAVSQNASKDELASSVARALNKSPRFATKMAEEILGGNYGAAGPRQATTAVIDPVAASPVTASPVTATTTTTAPTMAGPVATATTTIPTNTQPAPNLVTSPSTTSPLPTAPVTTTTINPTPIVTGLGQVFGGLQPIYTVGIPTYTTNAGILGNLGGDRTSSGGGDSGFGGGSGGGGGSAEEELKGKVNALSGKGVWSVKKKIAVWLLIGTAIGGGYYFYKHG